MAFSDIEKKNIRIKLIASCEESWAKFGYKKTSVDELCEKAGISKGAFYLFYESKEDLFYNVITNIQVRLVELTKKTLGDTPTKYDLSTTLKLIYREYMKIPFVFEMRSPDFIAFMNKLPKEKIDELEFHGQHDIQQIVDKTSLKYKVDKNLGNAAIGIVFIPKTETETLPYDHLQAMDFIIDTLINEIFE